MTTISADGSDFGVESSTLSILRCCGSSMRLQTITVASGGMALSSSINSETVILPAFSYLSSALDGDDTAKGQRSDTR
jgi:hypothetical protein